MRTAIPCLALAIALPLSGCGGSSPAPAGPAAKPAKPRGAASAPARPRTPTASGGSQVASPEGYSYQSGGRRDPFLDALKSGIVAARPDMKRSGEGVAGLLVNEITVRITVEMNGSRVAMIQAPDGRNYNVHQGDKLADGTVKSITPEGLVIMQDVNDPLSTAKQREVRKQLRSLEEAKQ